MRRRGKPDKMHQNSNTMKNILLLLLSILFFPTFLIGKNPDKIEPLWHDGFGKVGLVKVKLITD